LERLVTDREHYNQLASESRRAALDYAANLSVLPFEAYLEALIRKPQHERGPKPPAPLSDDKRKLLALRMKQAAARKSPVNLWFQNISELQSAPLRLFCFPFAGGGTLLYRSWMEALKPHAAICPACLPGRESRLNEPAIDRMEALLDALEREIEPHVSTPFAFYGHSMGAIIAFELARRLERNGRPLPRALYVSGARAPQFRLGHQPPPEPSDSELMEQLRKLEGMPREVLENPALLGVAMPALRADTRLYRNYVYQPGRPLQMPVYAYGGTTDPNVQRRHIEAWKEQTAGQFTSREFAGGHFFIQSAQKDFLESLISDTAQVSVPES
jgi:medium-chain acyl-[acyl-carrier-protein] hydrolase